MTKKHVAEPRKHTTDLVRVGDRDYIQGIVIAQAIIQFAFPSHRDRNNDILFVDVVKFPFKTLCNGTVRITPDDGEPNPADNAACILHGRWASGARVFGEFIPDPADSVSKIIDRDEFAISDQVETGRFSGTAHVRWENLAEFLKTLVEVNKRAIMNSLDPSEGLPVIEIVYVKDFSVSAEMPAFDGTLNVRNISEREFGSRKYVLNILSWLGPNGEETVEMAFSLEPAAG